MNNKPIDFVMNFMTENEVKELSRGWQSTREIQARNSLYKMLCSCMYSLIPNCFGKRGGGLVLTEFVAVSQLFPLPTPKCNKHTATLLSFRQ